MYKVATVALAIALAFLIGHGMVNGAHRYYRSHYGQYGYSNSGYGYSQYSHRSHYNSYSK